MAEAVFVVFPISIEIDAAIFASLNDGPAEVTVLELAIDEESGATARANGVDAVAGKNVLLLPSEGREEEEGYGRKERRQEGRKERRTERKEGREGRNEGREGRKAGMKERRKEGRTEGRKERKKGGNEGGRKE